ncbi:equilibrative nucleoside transporter 4 isoform X1 [Drosophila subobscura]|uniref:equilibrative nucleoside transporter 4 isoform X1 n=1 Tax=Drosophila subobscura TaxID=7241 RepID=UPI00155B2F4E|nr:equilibrative nucleoside transporter 4 isoform X1 [Drosophila subobscura]
MDVGGQDTTYEPLDRDRAGSIPAGEGGRRHPGSMDSPEYETRAPKDQRRAVYLALMAAGIGFVLPYNSFIIAADYWQGRFPGRHVALDMSMTYIFVAFATVLLNNIVLSLAPFQKRVIFGYMVSFTTLVFVAVCEVAWHMFATNTAYLVNMSAVALTAIGCTVQQSSFYGFASMLPQQYTQAVMAGESIAGFLVSSNRVVTKLLINNDRVSTVIFFLTSTLYIIFSYLLHRATINSPFVRYHVEACSKIILRPDEQEIDGVPSTTHYGVLSMDGTHTTTTISGGHAAAAAANTLSFSNPVYELSNPTAGESSIEALGQLPSDLPATPHEPTTPTTVAFKVEHVIQPRRCRPSKLSDIREGFVSRWRVAQVIYPYMVCIALAYCVTLSLYPGIDVEVQSCALGSWMPVLLMFCFNLSDVAGKMLAASPYPWSRRQLILLSGLRIVLVPLLLLCCAPRQRPVISGETAPFVFTIALGITNGLAGSLPMILAPAKVPGTLKEVTGNIMTLSYNVGLTVGSLIGYVFESMLGPQLLNPCPSYPYVPVSMLEHIHGHGHGHMPPLPLSSSTTIPPTTSTSPATSLVPFLLNATIATLTGGSSSSSSVSPLTESSSSMSTTASPALATVITTTALALYSTVAGSSAEVLNATMSTFLSTVSSSVGDISDELAGGMTTDPQTPEALLENI